MHYRYFFLIVNVYWIPGHGAKLDKGDSAGSHDIVNDRDGGEDDTLRNLSTDFSYHMKSIWNIKERLHQETVDDPYDNSREELTEIVERGKRDTIASKNEPNNSSEICRKKRKDGTGWNCQSSCKFLQELTESKQRTVCGQDGSVQKICCPYPIDPIKAAQEKCKEYSEFRYYNRKLQGQLGEKVMWKRTLDCLTILTLVIGGEPAKSKELPHMALIGAKEDDEMQVQWICGGSLISNQYVLSAAHCNDPTNPLIVPTWVLLGQVKRPSSNAKIRPGKQEGLFRIVQRINHPLYKPPMQDNDLSLFKLESPVTLGPTLRPLCLALPAGSQPTTNRVLASGWGRTASDEQESNTLLKVTIDRLPTSKCVETYKDDKTTFRNGFDGKSMICAGRLNETKDTCQGDSGGPLHSKIDHKVQDYKCMWLQEGITSLGSSYCGDGTPAVYTKVSNFLSWIQQIAWPAQDLKFT